MNWNARIVIKDLSRMERSPTPKFTDLQDRLFHTGLGSLPYCRAFY